MKASDLQGKMVGVTIDRVEYEPVGQQKEMKAIVYFHGKKKGLVLNKTNAKKIIALSGSALTEDWAGFRITLFPAETEFAGETVDCIRIRAANGTPGRTMPAFPPKEPTPPRCP
jgi:hypothetical protein